MQRWRPDLPSDPELRLPAAPAGTGLRVTFLGTSTLLLSDGETSVLTDGFFSRPSVVRVTLGRPAPDIRAITRSLRRAGIDQLAAVVALHSHYDHAMDVAVVGLRTGATLVGSRSAAMVGRGGGLSEDRLLTPRTGQPLQFGRFTLTLLRSAHVPPPRLTGEITSPVVPPVRISAYRSGPCYSLLVQHDGRSLLVHGSAGHVREVLAGHAAEVVYLAIGSLARRPAADQHAYWREVVQRVGAVRVLPIHWDDFARSLHRPLVPLPYVIDDIAASLRFVLDKGRTTGVDVRLPTEWQPTDPFHGLPAR